MALFPRNTAEQVATVAQQALTLITQHMHDCELRSTKWDLRNSEIKSDSDLKHRENQKRAEDTNRRLDQIESASKNRYMVLITSMLTIAIGVAVELFLKK